MKQLYESILSSTRSGKAGYEEMIKNAETETNYYKTIVHLEKIDFKTFLETIDNKTMEKFFKKAWNDSKKKIGATYFIFSDGIFSTEITKQDQLPGVLKKTVFRTIFIHNNDIEYNRNNEKHYELYAYYDYNTKYTETTDYFTLGYGERLTSVIKRFIEYLKDHYDILYNLKW